MKHNDKVLVFAGTTEGRLLTELFDHNGMKIHACVATDIGKEQIKEGENVSVSAGRMTGPEMRSFIEDNDFNLVVDATHPYAAIVSENIKLVCSDTGTEYIRVLRPPGSIREIDDIIRVPDIETAAEYLKGVIGNVLLTTGSKDLAKFISIPNYRERLFARVLSDPKVAETCAALGFQGHNLISMQGPFCEELNYGLIKQVGAEYLVTKDSGESGGFDSKILAAHRAGVKVILVERPVQETGMTYEESESYFRCRYGWSIPSSIHETESNNSNQTVLSLIGTGMGSENLTENAIGACRKAEVIFGSKRMREIADRFPGKFVDEYRPEGILRYLDQNRSLSHAAVLFSGDIGVHSGAKRLLESLKDRGNKVELHCGISSLVHFASRLMIPWEGIEILSLHGKEGDILGAVRRNRRVFVLLGGNISLAEVCTELVENGFDHVLVHIGEELGYQQERVYSGNPSQFMQQETATLTVALIENDRFDKRFPLGIPDESFIRGVAPMTKNEIRTLAISKLGLRSDSLIYDVGAGTGSVSIEMARVAFDGMVFAIERELDSVLLIEQNAHKFKTVNLTAVHATAPDAFIGLPPPTHAFIGGSAGNLNDIIQALVEVNPSVRMVVTAVTLETLSEILNIIRNGDFHHELVQISITKIKERGGYHMMDAQNPVHVITLQPSGENVDVS